MHLSRCKDDVKDWNVRAKVKISCQDLSHTRMNDHNLRSSSFVSEFNCFRISAKNNMF